MSFYFKICKILLFLAKWKEKRRNQSHLYRRNYASGQSWSVDKYMMSSLLYTSSTTIYKIQVSAYQMNKTVVDVNLVRKLDLIQMMKFNIK